MDRNSSIAKSELESGFPKLWFNTLTIHLVFRRGVYSTTSKAARKWWRIPGTKDRQAEMAWQSEQDLFTSANICGVKTFVLNFNI